MEKLVFEIKNSEHKEGRIYEMLVPPELLERIKKKIIIIKNNQELMTKERHSEVISDEYLSVKDEKGVGRFANRIWIPNMIDLKRDIVSKAHESG